MPRLFVGNTDNEWFDFLRSTAPHEEINFWKPSERGFNAIEAGELFVFRLKSPRNKIGGYGILVSSTTTPIHLAWEAFGISNGSPSMELMAKSIAQYRKEQATTPNTLIGCRILSHPVFFDEKEWLDVPSDWSNSIVSGKVYSTDSYEGERLYKEIEERIDPHVRFVRGQRGFEGLAEDQARYSPPVPMVRRLGQGSFRLEVGKAYRLSCSFSETKVLPALEAAHIRPFSADGPHHTSNGLFLRKDLHSVFDAGYATIDDDLRLVVSARLRSEFHNGNEYRRLHGTELKSPVKSEDIPALDYVRWHQQNRYVGD